MKLIKIFLSLCLFGLSLSSNLLDVKAEESSNTTTYIVYDEEKEKELIEQQIEEELYNGKQPRMDEIMYKYQLAESDISSLTNYYEAGGQQPGGVQMEAGGTMQWVDSSTVAETLSFGFSFSIGKSPISISVGFTPGKKLPSGIGSYSPAIPQELHNKYVKLYVAKKYVCNRYEVYTYNKYSGPSNLTFYGYQDRVSVYSISFKYKEVK